MAPSGTSTRERIISAASKLFYEDGIRGVGVDAVAAKAGITKRTLYYHFKSKDDLVAAYLGARDQPNLALFKQWFAETDQGLPEKVERIFQNAELATGKLIYLGRSVNPQSIRKPGLLTVEGGRDDICAIGQTAAAHDLCSGLRPHLKRHHLQANVGHYGVFSGKRWEKEIYPVIRNFILAVE